MQRESMQQANGQPRAAESADGQRANGQRENAQRAASQAERAVMHPDYSDPEWRYYHGAWHS